MKHPDEKSSISFINIWVTKNLADSKQLLLHGAFSKSCVKLTMINAIFVWTQSMKLFCREGMQMRKRRKAMTLRKT